MADLPDDKEVKLVCYREDGWTEIIYTDRTIKEIPTAEFSRLYHYNALGKIVTSGENATSSPMKPTLLGNDWQTKEPVSIGGVERRSSTYVLGKPGMGKSTILLNCIE